MDNGKKANCFGVSVRSPQSLQPPLPEHTQRQKVYGVSNDFVSLSLTLTSSITLDKEIWFRVDSEELAEAWFNHLADSLFDALASPEAVIPGSSLAVPAVFSIKQASRLSFYI